jgi:hypothetical protein
MNTFATGVVAALLFATPLIAMHLYATAYVEQPAASSDCKDPNARPGSRAGMPVPEHAPAVRTLAT